MQIKTLLLLLFILSSCKSKDTKSIPANKESNPTQLITETYELTKPQSVIKGLLILFGGYPETPAAIEREFKIRAIATQKGIAVLMMNYNRKLWLEEVESDQLAQTLSEVIISNQLPTDNIYIGGFSSGGNVSLLIANHLVKHKATIQPKGVFIVDSPIDLLETYKCAKRNVERNYSESSVRESQGIINRFDSYFGEAENTLEEYMARSPFLYSNNNIENLSYLKDLRIRMYTEPDTIWWKENRMNAYEDMNAFYVKQLAIQLKKDFNSDQIELIETKNRGIRANGLRHPHSWSIVDKDDLIQWILDK